MTELRYKPVAHDHEALLARARARNGFTEAYDALSLKYQVAAQMLKARSRAGRIVRPARCKPQFAAKQ